MTKLEKIRQAIADYIGSEGCSCCQNVEKHERHAARLAKLLDIPPYKDGSGHDFGRFRSDRRAHIADNNGDGDATRQG